MKMPYIKRFLEKEIIQSLEENPAVAILGPRQCGKTTISQIISESIPEMVYLDLEKPSDIVKLNDPEFFLKNNKGKLICIDEIQRKPELFSVLRSIIDENEVNGQFLILGSASRDLIRQSSETLAGRIAYHELTPFIFNEYVNNEKPQSNELITFWQRGGFPRSLKVVSDNSSFKWRINFIRTFLERDIPALDISIPAQTLERLWKMLAHLHGQIFNSSQIGGALGISHTTARKYIDLLTQTFVVRLLKPYEINIGKRLVKSPKVYIRDSGILHALLDIRSFDDLLGHPIYGSSWEGMVIENVITHFSDWQPYFYRTSDGTEIDLILIKGNIKIAIECKASSAPVVSRGFWNALEAINVQKAFVIAPVTEVYSIRDNCKVLPLNLFMNELQNY